MNPKEMNSSGKQTLHLFYTK